MLNADGYCSALGAEPTTNEARNRLQSCLAASMSNLTFFGFAAEVLMSRKRCVGKVRPTASPHRGHPQVVIIAPAIDRLTSGAHTLIIEGPSYRQRDRLNQRE